MSRRPALVARLPYRRAGVTPSVLITGGGTAGHTNPGIAVAEALVAAGLAQDRIHFVGARRGNEKTLVGDAGFSIDLLPGRGIQRRLTPSAIKDNVGAVAGLVAGLIKGVAVVAKRRPRVVLCLGGYAAFAASLAAVLLRIPLVVAEQNARASAVNRFFARSAMVCAVPFPGTDLPNGVVTGNPIRRSIIEAVDGADSAAAADRIARRIWPDFDGETTNPLVDRILVVVWSGSLGATRINQAVAELASRWADRKDVAVYHVVGRRDWPQFRRSMPEPESSGLCYVGVEYEDHMADLLVAADVAVCRAGASTVAELAVAGLPSILVPLPIAARDHQSANAEQLAAVGGALVVEDHELDADRLATMLDPLVDDEERRSLMIQGARSAGRPRAAHDVARLLLEIGEFDHD